MYELAKQLIGKDVYVRTIDGNAFDGILQDVCDNALVIEDLGQTKYINLDYVVVLREYPKNKNGKRGLLL